MFIIKKKEVQEAARNPALSVDGLRFLDDNLVYLKSQSLKKSVK